MKAEKTTTSLCCNIYGPPTSISTTKWPKQDKKWTLPPQPKLNSNLKKSTTKKTQEVPNNQLKITTLFSKDMKTTTKTQQQNNTDEKTTIKQQQHAPEDEQQLIRRQEANNKKKTTTNNRRKTKVVDVPDIKEFLRMIKEER